MHNQSTFTADKLKTLSALSIMARVLASDQKDQDFWNSEARRLVPGWSFLNCIQWLTGRKCLDSFAQIKDADLAAINLDADKVKAIMNIAGTFEETYQPRMSGSKVLLADGPQSSKIAEFTVFEENGSYWFVPKSDEKAAIAAPVAYRSVVFPTKISACRAALDIAVAANAEELHLYGSGATTGIKKDAVVKGINCFVYFASIHTKLR